MKILLSGATGFIGRSLLTSLLKQNHQIYALVRAIKSDIDDQVQQLTLDQLATFNEKMDVFVNLAGENIASQPWTAKRKAALYESRVGLTKNIQSALTHPPSVVISMSAVGFYGVARDDIFDENTPPKPGFAHDLCEAWESAANSFAINDTRVVVFRLGVVLGKGGALAKMRLPFKLGLGGPIAGGKQWFPWVHIRDVERAIMTAIQENSYNGTFNLVSPASVTQKEFASLYASSINRAALLPTPRWLLNSLFGEMASLLTEGARVIPKRLEEHGFRFDFSNIKSALDDVEQDISGR